MSEQYKPIRSITPANFRGNATGPAVTEFLQPNKYEWSEADLSAPDAGRTETGKQAKKRIGSIARLDLEWVMVSPAEAAAILQAFYPEYLLIEYLDARSGLWQTRHFYVGDRNSPLYNLKEAAWEKIVFGVIQATP
ncbi:MAG: hypothetical protein FH749_07820 [Firmicutes bacterium]|nr:hypothetical protein [Bacillota bacterium]